MKSPIKNDRVEAICFGPPQITEIKKAESVYKRPAYNMYSSVKILRLAKKVKASLG